jgi:hypothetical protein
MSEQSDSHGDEGPALINNNIVDALVAAVLLVVGVVVVFQARILGAEWTSDGPGSGYFPFYIGLIICIASLGILYQSLFSAERDTSGFVNRVQLKRVLSVFIPACVYVLGIVFLGIYVASAIYIAAFMVTLGKYPVVKSALLGLVISAFFFVMFEVWFKVPLYKGKFEPLSFLGY